MNDDLIKRSDAAEVVYKALKTPPLNGVLTDTMSLAIALVRDIPSADRPQGEWIGKGKNLWKCSNCEMVIYSESEQDRNEFHKWCSRCGCRMKGADDETD